VPEEFTSLTRVLPLDDSGALERLFAHEGDQIAAVIVEPVPANNGLLLQRPGFLQQLRDYCDRDGALLIFDEVISGFRIGPGGAAEHYGIRPDLATFGKVIGGGMPVGAFAGSAAVMAELSPAGSVYQAGTLSGNPVAMAAGLATLTTLEHEDGWQRLDELGTHLGNALNEVIDATGADASVARIGSIFWLALGAKRPPRSAAAIDSEAGARYAPIFRALLDRGIALAPSAYEVGFVSLLHSIPELDRLAAALQEIFSDS
jgi:glutamate-1-semialdehyde 2,1-aminomutase